MASFFIQKWWHFQNLVIAKIKIKEETNYSLIYLSYDPKKFGFWLENYNSADKSKPTNLQGFLRKNFATCYAVLYKTGKNDFILKCSKKTDEMSLIFKKTSPPSLEVITDRISHFRLSNKATYTKKSSFDPTTIPPLLEVVDFKKIIAISEQSSAQQYKTNSDSKVIDKQLKKLENLKIKYSITPLIEELILIEADLKQYQLKSNNKNQLTDLYNKKAKINKQIIIYQKLLLSTEQKILDIKSGVIPTPKPPKVGNSTKNNKKLEESHICYRLSELEHILVGKSASNNDKLTKSAKSNDTWLHVSQGTGSHIIIKTKLNKPSVQALKYAKIIAVHHSIHKKSLAAEVYITQKSNLKKTKNLALGKWLITNAKSYFVKYTQDDLNEVLKLKQK